MDIPHHTQERRLKQAQSPTMVGLFAAELQLRAWIRRRPLRKRGKRLQCIPKGLSCRRGRNRCSQNIASRVIGNNS